MNLESKLPIAIIGAGPIGLATAAHLSLKGQSFVLIEAGKEIADSVRNWEHVSMFSPWKFNLDSASMEILNRYEWAKPRLNHIPTGKELIEEYLLPLSQTKEIKPFIRLDSKVVSASRKRISKLKNFGRESAPFVLKLKTPQGINIIESKAVIDASGTWKNPKPSGADGLSAIGEEALADRIYYGIPDVLGKHRHRYLGKDVAVIGGGHSAINALLELADLKKESSKTKLTWILTKARVEEAYGGLDNDELPGRGRVGQRVKELVESNQVEVCTPFFVEEMVKREGKITIKGQSNVLNQVIQVDEIITATGLKPDIEMLRELRIALDQSTESPVKLAPMIDPNIHSCGTVRAHGEAELRHPEKNFYIVGMKSYGRAPTFLLATGYEQVRSVVAGLVGDWKAAKEVHLDLPETGVCGVPANVDPNELGTNEETNSCCDTEPAAIMESAESH